MLKWILDYKCAGNGGEERLRKEKERDVFMVGNFSGGHSMVQGGL